MKYDPRFTEMRDRCRRLAVALRTAQNIDPSAVAQLAEDLAVVADELNSLLNRLEGGPAKRPGAFEGFKPFGA
jgi:hypothetical protein